MPPQERSITRLIRQRPTEQDYATLDREVQHAHPRSAAILLSSEVELYLEFAILTRFPRNDTKTVKLLVDRDGPLSGFYAKIHLAYAMGIIDDDTCHDLNIIRRVRNVFAHAPRPIIFATQEVSREISRIKCTADRTYEARRPLVNALAGLTDEPVRERFIESCRELGLALLRSANAASAAAVTASA